MGGVMEMQSINFELMDPFSSATSNRPRRWFLNQTRSQTVPPVLFQTGGSLPQWGVDGSRSTFRVVLYPLLLQRPSLPLSRFWSPVEMDEFGEYVKMLKCRFSHPGNRTDLRNHTLKNDTRGTTLAEEGRFGALLQCVFCNFFSFLRKNPPSSSFLHVCAKKPFARSTQWFFFSVDDLQPFAAVWLGLLHTDTLIRASYYWTEPRGNAFSPYYCKLLIRLTPIRSG